MITTFAQSAPKTNPLGKRSTIPQSTMKSEDPQRLLKAGCLFKE